MTDKVYIVILNFKGHLDTIECLESCLSLDYTNFQIIIVDNSPSNESAQYIQKWAAGEINKIETNHTNLVYPLSKKPISFVAFLEEDCSTLSRHILEKIIFIKSKENKGFAAGNNLALRHILKVNDAEFVWLLNNDTVVESTTLTALKQSFQKIASKKKLGLLGSTLLDYSFPHRVQGIGGKYNKLLASTKHLAEGMTFESLEPVFCELKEEIDYVIGASIFTSTQFLKEVGILNEDYFLYFEELDWKKRGEEKGYKIDTCLAKIYHKEGASINQKKNYKKEKSLIADFYSNRSRILFTRKFFPEYIPTVYLSFIAVIVNRIRRSQLQRVKMIVSLMRNPNSYLIDKGNFIRNNSSPQANNQSLKEL